MKTDFFFFFFFLKKDCKRGEETSAKLAQAPFEAIVLAVESPGSGGKKTERLPLHVGARLLVDGEANFPPDGDPLPGCGHPQIMALSRGTWPEYHLRRTDEDAFEPGMATGALVAWLWPQRHAHHAGGWRVND